MSEIINNRGHLLILIYQSICIILYFFCLAFEIPGISVFSLVAWAIPIVFYFIATLFALGKKDVVKALFYGLFILLLAAIPTKFWFIYYNVILHFFVIAGFLFLRYKKPDLVLNKYFVVFAYLVVTINILLLFANDNFVQSKMSSNNYRRYYGSGEITWANFTKVDSIKGLRGKSGAEINTYISSTINHAYNYTVATGVARMNPDKAHYCFKSVNLNDPDLFDKALTKTHESFDVAGKLLEHEVYHFKIAALMTARYNKVLDKHHFLSPEETIKIFHQYQDSLRYMQKAYDKSTNHSLNKLEQEKWKLKIDMELGE